MSQDRHIHDKNTTRVVVPEPRQFLARQSLLILSVAVMSGFVNILTLAGPLYMLNAYNYALSGQSLPTLAALTLLMVGAFCFMGIFDFLRMRLMARIAARFRTEAEQHISHNLSRTKKSTLWPYNDLDLVHEGMESPGLMALFDLPWLPINLAALFMFHYALGIFAICVAITAITIAMIGHMATRNQKEKFNKNKTLTNAWERFIRRDERFVTSSALGIFEELQHHRNMDIKSKVSLDDRKATTTVTHKTTRMIAQSGILGLGIMLSITSSMSAGVIIAASILMARVMVPIDAIIASWGKLRQSYAAWNNLNAWFENNKSYRRALILPEPNARLVVEDTTVIPPHGRTPGILRANFSLEPGQILGIIGPSGAGKSSLIRGCAGAWPLASGRVLCGDVLIDHIPPEYRPQYFGFCADDPPLFPTSIGDNITSIPNEPNYNAMIEAAKIAGLHDTIIGLTDGYDTIINPENPPLSRSQRQALGLARAIYAKPKLLFLDAPDAFLDHTGDEVLDRIFTACRAANHSAVISTQRPSTLSKCDLVMVLEQGKISTICPTQEFLPTMQLSQRNVA